MMPEPVPATDPAWQAGGAPRVAANDPDALRVRCWGTRGSLPAPGLHTAVYGGNTSCVEVRTAGACLILDAGSGIRELGRHLLETGETVEADLFLTHFHWDHIQGLPFFAPLYEERTRMRVHGPPQNGVDIRTLLAGQMGPVYFPVPYAALAAELEFLHVAAEPWTRDGIEVSAHRARHAGETYGYRVVTPAGTLVYMPDNELVGGGHDMPGDWYDRLVDFARGADLLLHDAMFTAAEYERRQGWGHSTYEQASRLAEDAGVRRLHLFHHSPERTDVELRTIVDVLRADLAARGSPLVLDAAAEGEDIVVVPAKPQNAS